MRFAKRALFGFRPIMMTTFAAILGALPLVIAGGAGSELRRPLGGIDHWRFGHQSNLDTLYDACDLPLSRPASSLAQRFPSLSKTGNG